MLKTIPKSNISVRAFQVFKDFTISDSDVNIISASFESGFFNSGSNNYIQPSGSMQVVNQSSSKIYTHPLYESIRSKYYTNPGNPFTLFGDVDNMGRIAKERQLSSTIYVISIPQSKYGEKIKPGSIQLVDNTNGRTYTDTSKGAFRGGNPTYTLLLLNFTTGVIQIQDTDGDIFTGTITSFNSFSGLASVTFGSDTETFEIVKIDLSAGTLETSVALGTLYEGLGIDEQLLGNVFYSDGLLVLSGVSNFHEYTLSYKSTQTIYETEVFVNVKAGEFNYSQNPSAVEVQISGSYDFQTTAIFNDRPAGTKKITEIKDIKRREFYSGSYQSSISGSWEDYHTSASIDPTGSYLSPYITTIGLYDKDGEMVATAKLPKPIKNLPDYDVNFIVRLDT